MTNGFNELNSIFLGGKSCIRCIHWNYFALYCQKEVICLFYSAGVE